MELPRLLADAGRITVAGHRQHVRPDLYFDPAGRGRVAIRHRGVMIVEDVAMLTAYGLEESAWAQGHVRGTLDADFLTPLPARSGFDENDDWIAFLDPLDKYLPTLREEIDTHLRAPRAQGPRSATGRCGWRGTFSISTSSAIWRCRADWPNAADRSRRRHVNGGRKRRRNGEPPKSRAT